MIKLIIFCKQLKNYSYEIPSFKEIENIKSSLPTFYNIICYDVFMNSLKRPSDILKRKQENVMDPFKIKTFQKIEIKDHNKDESKTLEYIELSENLLPDFRISLLALHYVDEFAACDEGLAALLTFLYPEHASKILWFKIPKSR